MPTISMIMFSSHKEKDLLLNLSNYNKTSLKTDKPLLKLVLREKMITKHLNKKFKKPMKHLKLLMNHLPC